MAGSPLLTKRVDNTGVKVPVKSKALQQTPVGIKPTTIPIVKKTNNIKPQSKQNGEVNTGKCIGIGILNLALGLAGTRMDRNGKLAKFDIKKAALSWATVGAFALVAATGPIGVAVAGGAALGLAAYSVLNSKKNFDKANVSGKKAVKEEALIDLSTSITGAALAVTGTVFAIRGFKPIENEIPGAKILKQSEIDSLLEELIPGYKRYGTGNEPPEESMDSLDVYNRLMKTPKVGKLKQYEIDALFEHYPKPIEPVVEAKI